jgi:hypothetical protein
VSSPRSVAKDYVRRALGDDRYAQLEIRRNSHSLGWLAKRFGSDKAGPPGVHRYTQHYQKFFEPLRNERMVLLEIGIGGYTHAGRGGGSLRMWKHFFPNALIVGLDLQDKKFVEEDRIRVYEGDQADPEVLERIVREVGPPRIVIDDGSHFSHHVRTTFGVLFPLLENRGYYAIEDTQTSYWPEWHGSADRQSRATTMAMVKDLLDGLNYVEFVDDDYEPTYTDRNVKEVHCYHNLVIIRKGRNDERTNKRRLLKKRYARPDSSAAS